jgi:hypothetical protein
MAMAHDVPLPIDPETPSGNNLGRNGDYRAFETDAVKFQLQITLANEMSRFFIGFDVSRQIASARKDNVFEPLKAAAQVTENGVT